MLNLIITFGMLFGLEVVSQTLPINLPESRIVGGLPVTPPNKYPWLVSLNLYNKHQCGGMVYNSRQVITAAHCTVFDLEDWSVSFRIPNLEDSTTGHVYQVIERVAHPNYDTSQFDLNDIALWTIDHEFDLLPHEYITLDDGTLAKSTNQMMTVAGWGKLELHGTLALQLREVHLPIYDISFCVRSLSRVDKVVNPQLMLCAGYPEGGHDACQGDSGGPLFTYKDNRPFLVGIISWGHRCAQPDYPGVYTRVHRYRAFIEKHSQKST